jgi:hypothetical protein
MRGKKLVIGALIAVAVVFLIAYLASPVLAANRLVAAAKAGDEAALSEAVDFPAFRADLKEELNQKLVDEGAGDLGALGMLLAPAIVSGAVDAFVTPGAVATMVREAKAPTSTPEPASGRDDDDRVRQSWGYRSLDVFAVTLWREKKPGERIALLLHRRGLFGWKLAGVDLP